MEMSDTEDVKYLRGKSVERKDFYYTVCIGSSNPDGPDTLTVKQQRLNCFYRLQ